MGCGASASSRSHRAATLKADLRGLTLEQISALDASDRTPKSVHEEICRLRLAETTEEVVSINDGASSARNSPSCCTDQLKNSTTPENLVTGISQTSSSFGSTGELPDFDKEGQRLLAEAESHTECGEYDNLNMVWQHPGTGARLFVGNERAAASRDSLLELGIGGIVRCLDDAGTGFGTGRHSSDQAHHELLHYPIACWHRTGRGRTDKGIAQIVAPLIGFASDLLAAGRSVLIHCLAGAHRAGAAGTICIMHLCHLDARSAACAAKTARPCIELLAHLAVLPRKFHRAQLASSVEPAVEAARKHGFQAAAAKVFAGAK